MNDVRKKCVIVIFDFILSDNGVKRGVKKNPTIENPLENPTSYIVKAGYLRSYLSLIV